MRSIFSVQFFVIIIAFMTLSNSTPFSPIEAGTFFITRDDLKGIDTKTTKEINIQTPLSVFNQNLNIQVICAISSINIDERVSMQFTYKLADKQLPDGSTSKIIFVQIFDKNGFNFPEFSMGIDFLIAQNLRSDFYNMTSYQEHIMNKSLTDEQSDPSNKQVHNELFIFPNGFSSINRTHKVMYNYVSTPYDMYTIHFMTGMGHEEHQQGWNQNGGDFIWFRYVLYPRYPYGYKQCGAVYQTKLQDDFYFQCDKKGVDSYFYGLMGYGGANFNGQFLKSRTGFSFHVNKIDAEQMYNVVGFPFKISDKFQFIDNRKQEYIYFEQKNFIGLLAIAVGILIIGVVLFMILRKKKTTSYQDLQEEKVPGNGVSSGSNYSVGSPPKKGKSPTKKATNKLGKHQKTSDEQMKEQQHPDFPNEQVCVTEQVPDLKNQQDFSIE